MSEIDNNLATHFRCETPKCNGVRRKNMHTCAACGDAGHDEGYEAGRTAEGRESCPHLIDGAERDLWLAGYDRGAARRQFDQSGSKRDRNAS